MPDNFRNNNEIPPRRESRTPYDGEDNEMLFQRKRAAGQSEGGNTGAPTQPRQTSAGARTSASQRREHTPPQASPARPAQPPRQRSAGYSAGAGNSANARYAAHRPETPDRANAPHGASAPHREISDEDVIPIKGVRRAPKGREEAPHQPSSERRIPLPPRDLDQPTRKSDAASLPVPTDGKKDLLPQGKKRGKPVLFGKGKKKDQSNTGSTAAAGSNGAKADTSVSGGEMMSGIVKAIIYMVVVVVVATFISIFAIKIGNDVFAFVKSDAALDVTIPENAEVADVAEVLYSNGIIKYPSVFKLYASLKHEKGPFIAGSYTVSPSMSYDELRYAFKEHAATGTSWITIPEGYSCDEIIDLMVSNGIGKREKYIDVINNYDFDYWFIDELEANGLKEGRSYRLEGYLFPDTYEFYNASSEEMVVNKLLKRFNEVFAEDYKTKAAELGYSVDQVLSIASLIEKEAGRAADYMYVSSVFHNRLNNSGYFPRLESDATVVYAIQIGTGTRPTTVTPEDLNYDSPYNTYLHEGLMPGPITNPSASAIRYALYPAKTSYYYFVTANNGTAYYASSLAEHQNNIELVKSINNADSENN